MSVRKRRLQIIRSPRDPRAVLIINGKPTVVRVIGRGRYEVPLDGVTPHPVITPATVTVSITGDYDLTIGG